MWVDTTRHCSSDCCGACVHCNKPHSRLTRCEFDRGYRRRTVAQLEKSVTAYFDTAGSLLEEVYRHDVQQALRQYRAGGKKAS